MGKNIKKIQDMLDDKHERKIQSGYTVVEETHKVGDVWTDSDDNRWEQRKGYRVKGNTSIKKGLDQCKDCKIMIGGRHPMDKVLFRKQQRCFYCQIDFEAMLKTKGIWRYFVRLQQLSAMDSMENELEASIFEKHDQDNRMFDKTVANSIANSNVDTTMKVNKGLTK